MIIIVVILCQNARAFLVCEGKQSFSRRTTNVETQLASLAAAVPDDNNDDNGDVDDGDDDNSSLKDKSKRRWLVVFLSLIHI